MGKALFQELLASATNANFPAPITAAAVVQRLEPVVLFAAEIWPLRPSFYKQLDRLQADWAKSILGATCHTELCGALAVALCGWKSRLSSKAIQRACLFLAKVFLLPQDHPTYVMIFLARTCSHGTWWHSVTELMQNLCIPTLEASQLVGASSLDQARGDLLLRKSLLQRYKCQVVVPILQRRDDSEFTQSAGKVLPGLSSTHSEFCHTYSVPDRLGLAQSLIWA